MTLHRDLSGINALHAFAFVQGTDPASDPDNHVAARKAWVDTANSNALKIRNDANTGWLTVIGGSTQVSAAWAERTVVIVPEEFIGADLADTAWVERTVL